MLTIGAVWMFLTPALLFVVRSARMLEAVHEDPEPADDPTDEIAPEPDGSERATA